MAFPEMLVGAAQHANIAVPDDLENYNKEEFPHWFILCATQLCRPMQHGEHWENAKVITTLTLEQMQTMTYEDFQEIGVM